MVKLLFFCFRVTYLRLKKIHLELLTRKVHFYFLIFELQMRKHHYWICTKIFPVRCLYETVLLSVLFAYSSCTCISFCAIIYFRMKEKHYSNSLLINNIENIQFFINLFNYIDLHVDISAFDSQLLNLFCNLLMNMFLNLHKPLKSSILK